MKIIITVLVIVLLYGIWEPYFKAKEKKVKESGGPRLKDACSEKDSPLYEAFMAAHIKCDVCEEVGLKKTAVVIYKKSSMGPGWSEKSQCYVYPAWPVNVCKSCIDAIDEAKAEEKK